MHPPEVIRWVIAALLAFMGGWVIVMNYACVVVWLARRKHSSTVPLFGGLFFAGAMLLCPLPGVRTFAWLPLVVDIGCLPLLAQCMYSFGIQRKHKP